jgi:hypothetical protein
MAWRHRRAALRDLLNVPKSAVSVGNTRMNSVLEDHL